MPGSNSFDRFFLNLPPVEVEGDFDDFWKNSIAALEKIPVEPVFEKNEAGSEEWYEFYDLSFKGNGKSAVKGYLIKPEKIKKPKVIIYIPDYNDSFRLPCGLVDQDLAYFVLQLKGHDIIKNNKTGNKKEEPSSPGYLSENILEKDFYYLKSIYLDAYRSVGMLRLLNILDCSSIGIMGKGLGAAAAVFTAAYIDRINAAVLETPSFCNIELNQNISKSAATTEINSFIATYKSKKKIVKKNLSYFDSINFAGLIKCPVLVTAGLKDNLSPPECVFSLFNHLLCDKTAEVYPEDGNAAGGEEQFRKSIAWLKANLAKNRTP